MCDFHSSGALTDHIRLTVCWVRFTHSALARAHTIGEAHSHDGPLHVLGPRGAANWQPIFHRERQRGHRAAAGGHAAKKRREGGRPGSPGVFGAAIGVHQLRSVGQRKAAAFRQPHSVLQAGRQTGAVEAAYTKYRKRNDAKDLEALVRMVEEGKHGSAACMALVKVG